MRKILLVSSGVFHPPFLGRLSLQRLLSDLDGVALRTARSLEDLPGDLSADPSAGAPSYAALVLYFHRKRISDRALHVLETYVRGGGGLLALHSATASYKSTLPYFDILGGRFTGHAAVEPIEVMPAPAGPMFAGIPPFRVKDELYLHECRPEIEVQFVTHRQDQEIPIVWTYRYGQGRVCYAVPGHCADTMREPSYQQVIRQGLAWVTQSWVTQSEAAR